MLPRRTAVVMIACTTGSLSAVSTLLLILTGWSSFNFDKISQFHCLLIFSLPRCSAPNKTADYQKIYSDWWELTKYPKLIPCQKSPSLYHPNLIPLIGQTTGKQMQSPICDVPGATRLRSTSLRWRPGRRGKDNALRFPSSLSLQAMRWVQTTF